MIHKPIFAFDFSLSKPAMSVLIENNIIFWLFPQHLDEKSVSIYTDVDVNVINRNLSVMSHKNFDESSLICEHVTRSRNLAKMITETIKDILTKYNCNVKDSYIANEGFAFSAKGDAALDLSGYKYILMESLMDAGFEKFVTYSPITIKKTAGCSKKGMGKEDMINAFINEDINHIFIKTLKEHPEYFKKRTSYIDCIDDLADSFWCLKTTIVNEKIKCCFNGDI